MPKPRLFSASLIALAAIQPALAQSPPPAIADREARAATTRVGARKIILIGDSTVSVLSGWGGAFCANHLVSATACINLAREGRSTFSYRAEGSWDIALAEIQAGSAYAATYVLIQFGHNDQPGKPGHSTDLAAEFPANLRRYVAEARAAGATPILVTPLTRRQFKDGVLQDSLAPWTAAIRAVAAETDTPVVDLHARSREAVEAMGPARAMGLAQGPPANPSQAAGSGMTTAASTAVSLSGAPLAAAAGPNHPPAEPMATVRRVFDHTHLGPEGAAFFAGLVAEELSRAVPELRQALVR